METLRLMAALALLAGVASAQQNDGLSERGLRLSKQPGNVSYDIELSRGTERAIVQPGHHFQTGDRFTLRVRVSTNSYIYVLNRSLTGAPEQLRADRQVRLVPDSADGVTNSGAAPVSNDAASPYESNSTTTPAAKPEPTYSLVYPLAGTNRMLRAGQINRIPGSQMALEMDEHPGIEQLVLVISPTPLDIANLFSPATGELEPKSQGTYAGLEKQLAEMARNSEAETSTRGIEFIPVQQPATSNPPPTNAPPSPAARLDTAKVAPKPASVAAPKRPQQPYLVDIVLAHYAS